MFPTTKKVTLSNGVEVLCMDFTYGYMLGIENGTIEDTKVNAVLNGTDLDEESILELRNHELDIVFKAIMQLTYPHAYNEDGSLKELEPEDIDDGGKKKV